MIEELTLEFQQLLECSRCQCISTLEDSTDGLCYDCQAYRVENLRICTNCAHDFLPEFLPGDSIELDSWEVCPDCTITCEECDSRCEGTITVNDWNNQADRYEKREVCEVCADSAYIKCDSCGEWVNSSSITACGREDICSSCIDSFCACQSCGSWNYSDNMFWHENSAQDLCEQCYEQAREEENSSSLVNSYSFSPTVKFYTVHGREYNPSGMFHGIELECGWKVGDSDDYAESVVEALGEVCYLKEDGSITSGTGMVDGFEIVTHPCTLEVYREKIRSICNGKIPGLLSHNSLNAGLGLHISVNKSCLTNFAIARICTFIGADRNEAWIVKLARRKSSQWAEIIKKDSIEDTLDGGLLRYNSNRYEAVNLLNSFHVEFRLFRGSLKYSSIMLCLEFVNALCRWSLEPCDVSDYQSAASLLEFAKTEPETYPHLIKFLCNNI